MKLQNVFLLAGTTLIALCGYADNPQIQNANVFLYFPHLADGGPAGQRWQTRFTFTNPNTYLVGVTVDVYADNGAPLPLSFGGAPTANYTFLIPAGGTRIYRSTMSSPTIVTGWAVARATGPVMATVAFKV
jgi:hypothetical protein